MFGKSSPCRVVFYGAHTDDEMICAGTLHRLIQEGHDVRVVTFAPAAIESDRQGDEPSAMIVKSEWTCSLDAIGVPDGLHHREFVRLLPSVDFQPFRQRICQFVYDDCELHKPDIVFTLSPEDENTAHAIVGTETERVMRGRVPTVIRCQFPWNYGIGRPNLYVKLDRLDLDAKREVIRAYKSQHFRYEYERMLLAYCHADGLSVKAEYAEKFEIIRSVL